MKDHRRLGSSRWWFASVAGALVVGTALGLVAFAGLHAAPGDEPSERVATVLSRSVERITGGGSGGAPVMRLDVTTCDGGRRQGSMAVVDLGDRLVGVTAGHVVAGAGSIRVSGAGVATAEVELEAMVRGTDAALVDLDGVAPDVAAPVGPVPGTGAEVDVAGHPGGTPSTVSSTVLAAGLRQVQDPGSGARVWVDAVTIGLDPAEGLSGGVVTDAEGRAVAIVVERDGTTSAAVALPLTDVVGGAAVLSRGC